MPVSPASDLVAAALALHRRGAVAEAAALYNEALRADANHADAHYYLAMISCQHERFAEGAALARKALSADPQHVRAHVLLGRALSALRQHEEALASFDRAIALAPDFAQAHASRGDLLMEFGRNAEAIASYDQALALAPDVAEDWFSRGMALMAVGRQSDAITSFDRAIAGKPDFAQAHVTRAKALSDLSRYDDALEGIDKALAIAPDLPEAWLGRGNILSELKRYDGALAAFDKALAIAPDLAQAWLGRGNAFAGLNRHDEAFAAYDRTLALEPDFAEAWLDRGNTLINVRRYDDALAAYDRALALRPDLAGAWLGRGNTLAGLKRYDDAFAAYERALALRSDSAGAWLGRGNALATIKRHDDAFAAYDRALAIKPDLALAWLGRGNALVDLRRYGEASQAFDRALALQPDLAGAWLGRGYILADSGHYAEAFAAYDRAVALQTDLHYAEGERLFLKLHLCDWTNLDAEVSQLLAAIRQGRPASTPFTTIAIRASAADQLHCARNYIREQTIFPPIWRGEIYSHERIRLAYLSADFHDHATAHLAAGLFEEHDRSRFETTGISFGPDQNSHTRNRIKQAFERFVDVQHNSDHDIAALMRRLEIDIAVDLKGFTTGNRLNVLARRGAPIQVNYLGYPGTMGAGFIDYILADSTTIPEDQREFYTEQVIWLPECYQINDRQRRISDATPSRRQCGLPDDAFVFCCFNNTYKITPELFDIWARILRATDNSVLWLFEGNSSASANQCRENLRREAEQRGVSSQRLIFAPRAGQADHLARHRQADLFLDTVPCNAHTTASDALWAGLPLLTCLGATFAGRVAGSLLKAAGLDELAARSLDEYEALALKLAHDPSYLASLKDRLSHSRDTAPLFDTARMTRHIEAAYVTMWERYQRGEGPQFGGARPIGRP